MTETPLSTTQEKESALSVRLRAASEETPEPEVSREEREVEARKHLSLSVQGYRVVKLLGVGPVSAAYEAVQGSKDAVERAVVRIMVGSTARNERCRSLFL